MSILATLCLELSKNRFKKKFKPLGIKKKRRFLVSAPYSDKEFWKMLPFLCGLKKLGNIVMLVPQQLAVIYQLIKPNAFEAIFCETPSKLLSKEHKKLKEQLRNRDFHFLIELNKPANISLPYLTDVKKRICFYKRPNFPYYNIMIKDNMKSLYEFFNIKEKNPQNILQFYKRDLKTTLNQYGKKRPLLFVNGEDKIHWRGDKIIVGKDISPAEDELYKVLYFSDAYYGRNDARYEFAKILNKEIIK